MQIIRFFNILYISAIAHQTQFMKEFFKCFFAPLIIYPHYVIPIQDSQVFWHLTE